MTCTRRVQGISSVLTHMQYMYIYIIYTWNDLEKNNSEVRKYRQCI